MPMIDLRSRETLIQQINELDEKNEKQQQEIAAFKEETSRPRSARPSPGSSGG